MTFLRTLRLHSWLNQGWLNLLEVVFVGTYCCWASVIMFLSSIQSSFTGVCAHSDVTRSFIPLFMTSLSESMSALFQQGIVLWVGLIFCGWHRISASMEVSWSPNPGCGKQLSTNVGRFVSSKSRHAFFRVLKWTTCVSLASSKMLRKSSFNFLGVLMTRNGVGFPINVR